MGPSRSQVKVARELGKSPQLLARWSKDHRWVARAEAWDRNEEREYRIALAAKRRKAAERHANIAGVVQNKVVERLQNLDATKLSPNQLAIFLELGIMLERKALGDDKMHGVEPPPKQGSGKTSAGGPGGAPAPREDLAALSPEERVERARAVMRELNARIADEQSGSSGVLAGVAGIMDEE
jgi:hypothetical protein